MKKKLVIATNNPGKIREFRALLEATNATVAQTYEICSLRDIGCTADIPETADTFAGNAFQKADYIRTHYHLDCFADDSGLEVHALHMAPGVYSARYAGPQHDDAANLQKLLHSMEHEADRRAQFRTVIVLLLDGQRYEFEGLCPGTITTQPQGTDGFGYDPVFCPDGHTCTFAQMDLALKNRISHRAQAVKKLVAFLSNREL